MPSGDHFTAAIALPSSVAKSFSGCSPFGPMSHTSRSPKLPVFVVKVTFEPSGATDHAVASSRILRGGPPKAETTQILVCCSMVAFARKRVPSGNQGPIHHSAPLSSSAFGCGIVRISPVAVSCKWIPFTSQ